MIVVRKFFMSLLWFVIFLLVALIGIVAVVVSGLDMTDQEAAVAAAEFAGQEIGQKYGLLIFGGSALLAVVGSIFGVLPFTRHNKRRRD